MNLSFIYSLLLITALAALALSAYYLLLRWRQAEKDKKIQQMLFTLSRRLACDFSLEAVLQGLAESLSAVIAVSRIGVVLFEEGQGVLYGVHDERGAPPVLPFVLDLERYPELREVLWSPKILYISEVSSNPLFSNVKMQMNLSGINSLLVAPLNHQGRVFGALTLAQHGGVREFSAAEIELCEAVAASAAIALANRELFEELKKQAQELVEKNEELLTSYRTISAANEEYHQAFKQLQETQHKLIEQEKLKILLELAYAAAHEINQPLATLSLLLESLKEKSDDAEERKSKIELAVAQTYRMAEVVRKLTQLDRYKTTEYVKEKRMIDLNDAGEEQ